MAIFAGKDTQVDVIVITRVVGYIRTPKTNRNVCMPTDDADVRADVWLFYNCGKHRTYYPKCNVDLTTRTISWHGEKIDASNTAEAIEAIRKSLILRNI